MRPLAHLARWLRPALIVAAAGALASAAPPLAPAAPDAPGAPGALRLPPPPPGGPAPLTKPDVDAWLDGFLPGALARADIAGAQVAVVKDGQVLTLRGYGLADVAAGRPVDPVATAFRAGSVSKLLTWTAVMQLVEAGKLDLDADINRYLDFAIPPAFGQPITLRHLLTHTPGFAEQAKYLLSNDPATLPSLRTAMTRQIPPRLYPPGKVPAYSNYGAALAGYIVERASGEPFAAYVERHIFAPLGMAHSSFRQPPPPALAGALAKGYERASAAPRPYEYVAVAPAGSMTTTASDMSRFMLAYLAGGKGLLKPASVAAMFADANRPIPGLPAMGLGFYHEDRNGLTIVGHGGDTALFHTDLHLIPGRGVGIYMAFNSTGQGGAVGPLREALSAGFIDRYFPAPPAPPLPTLASARAHGAAMVGHYISSRAPARTYWRLVELLGETSIAQNPDGTIVVSSLLGPGGTPRTWREVAPWQWQEVGGTERFAARVEGGRVVMASGAGTAPVIELLPAPFARDAGWMIPALLAALAVMLVAALAWPVRALLRRKYGARPERTRRALLLDRAAGATGWCALALAAGWLGVIQAITGDLTLLGGQLDPWIRVLHVLALALLAGAVLAVWRAARVLGGQPRRLGAGAAAAAVAAAALFLGWFVVTTGLLTATLEY